MKKIEIFEKAMNEGGSLKDYGINSTLFAAYRDCQETGNDNIDFNEVIWDYDIPEIVKALKENGISEFTISSTFSSLIETLAAFEKEGIAMSNAEVTMIPQNYVTITDEEDKKKFQRILDLLDVDDDVQDVYTNCAED